MFKKLVCQWVNPAADADTQDILTLQQLRKIDPSPRVVQKGFQEYLHIDCYGIS